MKERVLTGVIAGAVFLALLAFGGYAYAGMVLLLAVIGFDEYMRMIGLRKSKPIYLVGLIGTLGLTLGNLDGMTFALRESPWIWLLFFVLFSLTVMTKNKTTIDHAALVLIGSVYMGCGFHYMIATRLMEHGLFWTLLVFICIWTTDSGAYFSGRFFGKHLLWPTISPKKTVEGALGGLVLSIVAALVFQMIQPELLTIGKAVLLGAVIGIVGQLGDLMQSAYKRVKGIKDTGALLPGHGGVLDRVDSWIIVFPFIHLFSLLPN
jgi:phosphatidate cytidylyltransferase